jgi:hypothetical protein
MNRQPEAHFKMLDSSANPWRDGWLPRWIPQIAVTRENYLATRDGDLVEVIPPGWRAIGRASDFIGRRDADLCVPWWLAPFVKLEIWLAWRLYHHLQSWLIHHGIWRMRGEMGYFKDWKLAHPRYWFRGRAPCWGQPYTPHIWNQVRIKGIK